MDHDQILTRLKMVLEEMKEEQLDTIVDAIQKVNNNQVEGIDVNEVQAQLSPETPYKEKFEVTSGLCSKYIFFQMLNTQHPEGNFLYV
jgi:hypothetical protein